MTTFALPLLGIAGNGSSVSIIRTAESFSLPFERSIPPKGNPLLSYVARCGVQAGRRSLPKCKVIACKFVGQSCLQYSLSSFQQATLPQSSASILCRQLECKVCTDCHPMLMIFIFVCLHPSRPSCSIRSLLRRSERMALHHSMELLLGQVLISCLREQYHEVLPTIFSVKHISIERAHDQV